LEARALLTSRQMAAFVAHGFLRFDEIVPPDMAAAALDELSAGTEHAAWKADDPRANDAGRPLAKLWTRSPAIGPVLRLPRVAGIIDSLLGPEARYDHHYAHVIAPRQAWSQPWHADAVLDTRPLAFDIQLLFFFHDTPREMGGTMYLPGSHLRKINESAIARYQNFVGQESMACSAGSLLVAHHGIWHCGQPNRTDRARTMFKLRLNPRVPQRLLWDTSDLRDARIGKILSRDHRWYGHDVRLEIVNRIRLWRELTGDPRYDVDFWLTRIENDPLARVR